MVFSAHVMGSARTQHSAFGANAGEASPNGERMGTLGEAGQIDADVRIHVNILAATDDGGLVAEISEQGRERNAPSTRVGITKEGHVLVLTSGASLYDEESGLLEMLARNFVYGHDTAAGASWKLPFGADDNGLNVKVTGADNGRISLALRGQSETKDGDVRQQLDGTVLYDTSHTTPIKASLTTATQSTLAAGRSSENMTVEYSLESDSLGAK